MIKLEGVTLDFPVLPHKVKRRQDNRGSGQGVGGRVSSASKGRVSVRALDSISITLNPGDKLALLGHNGAGKTTLLRVMAGLYAPTQGSVHCEGRVAPLLNLSFGMDMEATGYDNIWVRGLFLGMTRSEIRQKIDSIAKFSELADFLHLPMRTYSSGMRARLAFAISTHVDADILLLDEVVATGDSAFFQKARGQLEVLAGSTNILVLASHSNKVLREICNKGLLLEHGKIQAYGELDDVIAAYKTKTQGRSLVQSLMTIPTSETSDPPLSSVKRVLLINDTGMQSNPGCRAVRKAYKLLFHQHLTNTAITASIPVNYWIEHFRGLAVAGRDTIVRRPGEFASGAETAPGIDMEQWERIRVGVAAEDEQFAELLASTDVVVINGEGSIHHNSMRALAILALMRTATEAGKKTLLMNATLQHMDEELLRLVLSPAALVHVREGASKALLDEIGIPSVVTADLAFLALDDESVTRTRLLDASRYILITGGVAVDGDAMTHLCQTVESVGLHPVYFSIGDGGETNLAKEVCSRLNVPLVEATDFGLKELIDFFRQFPCAISGRHHINVYLMRAGVPFVSLPSNTWKVEQTLKFVGYPRVPVRSFSELRSEIQYVVDNRSELAGAANTAYQQGKGSLSALLDRLKSCI